MNEKRKRMREERRMSIDTVDVINITEQDQCATQSKQPVVTFSYFFVLQDIVAGHLHVVGHLYVVYL